MIRRLCQSDIPLIIGGAEEFYKESGMAGEINPSHFLLRMAEGVGSNVIVVLADEVDGVFSGAIAIAIHEDMYTGEKTATELFWYVRKPWRSGSIGIRLLSAAEGYAASIGAKRFNMIHLCSMNSDVLSSFYKKRGFSPIEVCYTKSLAKRAETS